MTGSYVFRLTASDGSLSATDDATVIVQAVNQSPLVSAGANQDARDDIVRCTPRAFGICTAASWGFVFIVKRLLAGDPSLANPNDSQTSPLHEAVRGKHIQVGIMESGQHAAPVPVDKIISRELEILGSHGMQAHRYPEMLALVRTGKLQPQKLVGKTVSLESTFRELVDLNMFTGAGVTVINSF